MKNFDRISILVLFAFFITLLFSQKSLASNSTLNIGYNYHVGPDEDSTVGSTTYSLGMGTETDKGNMRWALGFGAIFGSNILYLGENIHEVNRFGMELKVGPSFHFFKEGRLLPIFSAFGVLGTDLFSNSAPPDGYDKYQTSLTFGYELEGGMSFGVGKKQLRLLGVYRSQSSTYSGISIKVGYIGGRLALVL